MKTSDRYLKIVEWSKEDQCYVGTCPGLMMGGVHGKNEAHVYKQLCKVVNDWIKIHEKDGDPLPKTTSGKEFSGKFMLRLGKSLHKSVAIAALRQGESLNNFCIKVLAAMLPNNALHRTSEGGR